MRPCGHRRRLLRYSSAAASIRSSADIVSGSPLPEARCVAIGRFFTYFSLRHARRALSPRGSVAGPEHGHQGRKVHPSLALRHGACISLFRISLFRISLFRVSLFRITLLRFSLARLRGCGAGRLLLDQADQRVRRLGADPPHRRNGSGASAQSLFSCQCIFVADHSGCGARPIAEIVERPGVEPLEAIGYLAFERPQCLDLFLDRGANALRVAAAGRRADIEGEQNRKCQRHAGECCEILRRCRSMERPLWTAIMTLGAKAAMMTSEAMPQSK